jgi:universal stress protein A
MYQHVLAAVDLSDNSDVVLKAAKKFIALGAKVSVVHVCPGRVSGYGEATSHNHIANEMQCKQEVFPEFKRIVEAAGVDQSHMQLFVGSPAEALHKFAEDKSCDLILVGSHGTEGVRTLLGSTAHAVLQGASCDVLTVRIYD